MIRSRSTGNVMTSSNILKRQSDIIPLKKKIYNKALPMNKRRTLPVQKQEIDQQMPSMYKQSTAPILGNNHYQHYKDQFTYKSSANGGYSPYSFEEQNCRRSVSNMPPPLNNAKYK